MALVDLLIYFSEVKKFRMNNIHYLVYKIMLLKFVVGE